MTVVLVRHASTAWTGKRYCGTGDPPLDAAGRGQLPTIAARVDRAICGSPGMVVVTSPLRRARETAEAIVEALGGPPPRIDRDWREVDFGEAEGRTWDELEARFPELASRILEGQGVDWPGGDTDAELTARVTRAWSRTLEAAGTVPVVIVTHAGPLRIAASLAGIASDAVAPGDLLKLEVQTSHDPR